VTKLHIFDMDGTLLQGSACLHISEYAGCIDQVNLIEEAWSRGEVGHVEFYRLCLPLWAGLDDAGIEAVFDSSPWIDNVAEVFADIAARGEYSAVITLSPMFFAERLLRWGLTTAHGARVHPGEPPDPACVLTPASKVEISAGLMQQYGLGRVDCVAYGDSASDLLLFDALPNTVAVNASPKIAALSQRNYVGRDLWEAYQLGRALIEPASLAFASSQNPGDR
jgi:phosphoserine phosphatase